jgi:hypothetical protein
MDEKINKALDEHVVSREALWKKMDLHAEKLEKHNGFIKWIIGIGSGIGGALSAALYWVNHK